MPDAAALRLDSAMGERLARPEYRRDFRDRHAPFRNRRSWKFERRQHFEEADPSREALRGRDGEQARRHAAEALRLFARYDGPRAPAARERLGTDHGGR
ncbi:hypothetical protein [Allonocardiopsis opalescens]|uniref:Uncharacterized protein n=1 Tax=Allonocardiopsis opalescens TaxID=1144618 RepID=A0A2T0Q7V2_9ACTN|nr:hypothetical protein [Allonocardiopsis opalescens]PRX99899.1 hypothetical protein CLV72_103506 [Allonocardiopsis opalescens]